MDWNFLMANFGPHIISGIAIYAGIRADLKLLKFKVNTLWRERYGNTPDTQ